MLGRAVQECRHRAGLTVTQLAGLAGIKRESLSRIESGDKLVGVRTLLELTDWITLPASEWVPLWLQEETRLGPLLEGVHQLIDRGEMESAALVLKQVRKVSRSLPSARWRGQEYRQLGRFSYNSGEYARALHWLRLAQRAAQRSPDPVRQGIASYNYALALWKTHFIAGSLKQFNVAASLFAAAKTSRQVGYARLARANLFLEIGSYREALVEYRRAEASLREDPWLFECKLGEAICRGHTQSPIAALSLFDRIDNQAATAAQRAKCHHNAGVLWRQAGMVDRALLRLSLALESKSPDSTSIAATIAEVCLCRALIGDANGACTALEQFTILKGEKSPRDIWAMAFLSNSLTGRPLPTAVGMVSDNHEGRLTQAAAFCVGCRSQVQ